MTHTYHIAGMTCNNCVAKAKSALLKLNDVLAAEVQLAEPQATITMQDHIGLSKLQKALSEAGNYTITENHVEMSMDDDTAESNSYLPIFLIFAYITGVTLLVQFVQPSFNRMQWMSHFMAGFFLVFSFFKLMNLKGFAEGYRMYDVVAKQIPAWGFIYPFIELILGIAFLTRISPILTNTVALVVMAVSTIGVIKNLMQKQPFQCACLGTVIKLPLSKVTLFEDVLMVLMSGLMLVQLL